VVRFLNSNEKTIVLKLSGSIFFSELFGPIARSISTIVSQSKELQLVIVAGGGPKARSYIKAGSGFGLDQASLDELGIAITRANAQVLVAALGSFARPTLPENLSQLVDLMTLHVSKEERVTVCGGFHPGQSTNAVAALIAEKTRAQKFVNATDVQGVYDKDPNQFSDANFLNTIFPSELSKILGRGSKQAGAYDLMDPVALQIIERSKIPTIILQCKPTIIARVLKGKRVRGTSVVF
jgi:uridylate kinase